MAPNVWAFLLWPIPNFILQNSPKIISIRLLLARPRDLIYLLSKAVTLYSSVEEVRAILVKVLKMLKKCTNPWFGFGPSEKVLVAHSVTMGLFPTYWMSWQNTNIASFTGKNRIGHRAVVYGLIPTTQHLRHWNARKMRPNVPYSLDKNW